MLTAKPDLELEIQTGIWIGARDYSTGAVESRGLWTGVEHRMFEVNGAARAYYGVQHALMIPSITYVRGATVQTQQVHLGPLRPEVQSFIKGLDLRLAPAEIHSFVRDPSTGVWTIERIFIGETDGAVEEESEVDENGETFLTFSMTLVSSARRGTKTLPLKKSDSSQRLTDPADGGRRYSDIAAEVKVVWMGEVDNPYKRGVADERQR